MRLNVMNNAYQRQQFNPFEHHKALLTLKLCTLRKRESKISNENQSKKRKNLKIFPFTQVLSAKCNANHVGPARPSTWAAPWTAATPAAQDWARQMALIDCIDTSHTNQQYSVNTKSHPSHIYHKPKLRFNAIFYFQNLLLDKI